MAHRVEALVEGIGYLPVELENSFILLLRYVLSMTLLRRNLILVSRLDDQNIQCHFGDHKYTIHVNANNMGLAI